MDTMLSTDSRLVALPDAALAASLSRYEWRKLAASLKMKPGLRRRTHRNCGAVLMRSGPPRFQTGRQPLDLTPSFISPRWRPRHRWFSSRPRLLPRRPLGGVSLTVTMPWYDTETSGLRTLCRRMSYAISGAGICRVHFTTSNAARELPGT